MRTIGEAAHDYVRYRAQAAEIGDLTAANLASRLATLVASTGDGPLAELDRGAVAVWLRTVGDRAPATRRAYVSTVKGFCAWAVTEGLLTVDPAGALPRVREPRRVPRALSARAVAAVLASCPDARALMTVEVMVGCGLRCCELARARVDDYDADRATLVVRGKGDHERVLPVPAEATWAIAAYLAARPRATGWLFVSATRPGPVTAGHLSRYVRQIMVAAGVKRAAGDGVGAHALRHTCASDVLDRCHDLRVVQEMLGHVNLATTAVYLRRASQDQLRAAMEGRHYRQAG